MRVLDLGCGTGKELASWGISGSDQITGIDIDDKRLNIARDRFPQRTYLQGAGENIPLPDATIDRVICSVALPYMNIPAALREISRILVPGGELSLALHLPGFCLNELIHNAIPKPIPTLFRLYVISNGLIFHTSGKTIGFMNGRTESFQTERGMKIALTRAGFTDVSFHRENGPTGETFTSDSRKPGYSTVRAASA
jgi:ubiquinone/menaquinone biosynthesis C-methylase UbiE